MTLWDRLYDNEWFVSRTEKATHTDLAAELRRAREAVEDATADVERARAVSPAAVAVALSSMNAAQAGLARAEARAAAAEQCTHVVAGHAFTITTVEAADGSRERVVESCTVDRKATLRSPVPFERVWTAVLTDPRSKDRSHRVVRLEADADESLAEVCRWVATGQLWPVTEPHRNSA
jgi:hypothetical protein